MAYPITGPISYYTSNPHFSIVKSWYRQTKPYNLALPFSYEKYVKLRGTSFHYNGTNLDTTLSNSAISKAERRLRDKVNAALQDADLGETGGSSQWGNNFAEAKKGFTQILLKLRQLRRFTQAVRHFQFDEAFKQLGFSPFGARQRHVKKKLVRNSKEFANNWLAYRFFLKPTVEDIQNSVKVMGSSFDIRRVRANSGKVYDQTQTIYHGTWPSYLGDPPAGWRPDNINIRRTKMCQVKMGCDVRISNPNEFLAQQLGLASPVAFLWEATPWSFVADWFGNLGQFLTQYDFLSGLEVSSQYTVVFQRNFVVEDSYYRVTSSERHDSELGVHCYRTLSFPPVVPQVYPFKGFSLIRGITAVSLLVQQLRT